MAQFLYLVPKKDTPEKLSAEYGLEGRIGSGPAYRGCHFAVKGGLAVLPGTDGAEAEHDGIVMGVTSDIAFKPEVQTWERVEEPGASGPWWLGFYTDNPPGAADLLRQQMYTGYSIELGNGERWAIPPARKYPEGTGLPSTLRLEADGTETNTVHRAYAELFAEVGKFAEPYYAALKKQADAQSECQPELPEMSLGVCIELIGINYRVGRPEVNVLGLLTESVRVYIGLAAIDWWAFLQIMAADQDGEQPGADPTPSA